ncbi:MAG: hypothetical protein EHM63_00310 [Actinobacteria bacterium]|nr:MAG: hypothetical protein EHM63_00310 [Actinomycetota bacterium]
MNALITGVIVMCSVAACAGTPRPSNEATPYPAKPACTEQVTTIWDGQPTACDLGVGQTLDVLLDVTDEDAAEAERQCDDMGGSVTWDDDLPAWRCQDADH